MPHQHNYGQSTLDLKIL